jgi:phosphoserine phosphatase
VGRIKAVILDLDGTLVRYRGVEFESSWGAIAAAIGKQKESELILEKYLERRDAYEKWVELDAALLTGVPVEKDLQDFPTAICNGGKRGNKITSGQVHNGYTFFWG